MAITPDCGAGRFVLTGGALVAYAVGDIALCALVHANGSARSWQALTAFAALVAGFFSFAASLGCMALATSRDQHERTIQQRRPDYARIAELRYDTGRPIAAVVAAAERQAEREFGRETGTYPVAATSELAKESQRVTVTLPRNLEAGSLGSMRLGMTRYTTPWALWADSKRTLWLRADAPAETGPHGTVSMRVDLRRDGYHVFPPRGERYRPEPGTRAGAGNLPVAKLH